MGMRSYLHGQFALHARNGTESGKRYALLVDHNACAIGSQKLHANRLTGIHLHLVNLQTSCVSEASKGDVHIQNQPRQTCPRHPAPSGDKWSTCLHTVNTFLTSMRQVQSSEICTHLPIWTPSVCATPPPRAFEIFWRWSPGASVGREPEVVSPTKPLSHR
jgi:hypothetical protein